MKIKYLTGSALSNATLDKEIKDLKGIVQNVNERVQVILVGIIAHANDSGDCSRAKPLVNTLRTQEDRRNAVEFLAYFGNVGCKMEKGVCTEVNRIDKGSKRYHARGTGLFDADVDGAKSFDWWQPYDADGNRFPWFAGPPKPLYTPGTLGNLGENVMRFADRFLGTDTRDGELSKTKDNGAGKQVPIYDLTDHEREQATAILKGMRKLGLMLMARERTEELTAEVVKLNAFVDATTKITEDLENLDKVEAPDETEVETPASQAVAG